MKNQTFQDVRGLFDQPIIGILESILISFVFFLAISTILLMIGLVFAIAFYKIALFICLSAFVTIIPVLFAAKKYAASDTHKRADSYCLVGLLLISLCGAILSASINRPDMDDSIYVPKAVFYAENPDSVIDKSVNWIAFPDKLPTTGVFQYYEITQAAFASVLDRGYLNFYHIIFPGIVGFCMCLTMFMLLRVFESQQNIALLTMPFFILLLMALGEAHRSYGNFAIARAFQGKCMFLSVGVPAWVYFSIRYFLLQDKLSWIALAALGLGMAGATTTAMIFLPFLSLAIMASYYVNENKPDFTFSDLKLPIYYFATLIPLAAMTLDFYFYAINHISAGSSITLGFPNRFDEQRQLLTNPEYPLSSMVFVFSSAIVGLFSEYRKFFSAWILLIIALFLNPIVSDFIIKNITTETIYWRLFYLLPFPLVACVAFSILLRGNNWIPRASSVLLSVLFLYTAFWGPTSVLRPENGAVLGDAGYKISEHHLVATQEIADRIPPSSMFSPLEISSNIMLLSSHYPQFHMREDYLGLMLSSVGHAQEFNDRAKAYAYLYNKQTSESNKLSFIKIVTGKIRPNYVVVRNKSTNHEEIMKILLQEGYELHTNITGGYEVFSLVKA
jgi:Family of unknown function (DUF6077)